MRRGERRRAWAWWGSFQLESASATRSGRASRDAAGSRTPSRSGRYDPSGPRSRATPERSGGESWTGVASASPPRTRPAISAPGAGGDAADRSATRAWQTANDGFFTKEHFEIDLQRRSVTCPAGRTVKIGVAGKVAFRADECAACELKSLCTPARRRSLSVHRQEALLIRLRQDLKTKSGRRELRKRVAVEHRLARIGFIQGRRARYKGSRKNELDLNRSAAIANLQEVERLRRCA